MRDPKRIDRVLELVRAYWRRNPDLRLGQLVGILASITKGELGHDAFYFEDDKLEEELRTRLEG